MRKYFTVEEANRLVPMLRIELAALKRLKREMEQNLARRRALLSVAGAAGFDELILRLEWEIERAALEAKMHMNNISRTGAELKDPDIGLIDFPAWKDGVEVGLCWRMDEEKVSYWHGKDAGFMGRMPIED